MPKKKLKLNDLKVRSFVTNVGNRGQKNVLGGITGESCNPECTPLCPSIYQSDCNTCDTCPTVYTCNCGTPSCNSCYYKCPTQADPLCTEPAC
jgi:hypothetical protein